MSVVKSIASGSIQEQEIISKYESGATLNSLGRDYNVSKSCIRRLLIRTNTPLRPKNHITLETGQTKAQRSYQYIKSDPVRYQKYKDTSYDCRLKRDYKYSLEEYKEMHNLQKGKCAICKEVPDKKLRVDHDHKTGSFRGLLCDRCNRVLGFINDDISILESAVHYLETRLVDCGEEK